MTTGTTPPSHLMHPTMRIRPSTSYRRPVVLLPSAAALVALAGLVSRGGGTGGSGIVKVEAFNPLRPLRRLRFKQQKVDTRTAPPPPPPPLPSPPNADESFPSPSTAALYRDPDGCENVSMQHPLVPPPAELPTEELDIVDVATPSLGAEQDEDTSDLIQTEQQRLTANEEAEDTTITPRIAPADASSDSGKQNREEEILHRSLLMTRLEMEHQPSQSHYRSPTMTEEGEEANADLQQRVAKILSRVKTIPLFQLNTTSDVLAEIAPPNGLNELLRKNTTMSVLAQRSMERSITSITYLAMAVSFVSRALWKTATTDTEIRDVFQCARRSIGRCADKCRRAGKDHKVVQAKTRKGALMRRTRVITAAVGTSVASAMLFMWAFVLGVMCSSEACEGVGLLRDSAREASAAVIFAAVTVARAAGALGRGIVSSIRAAQLPVDN